MHHTNAEFYDFIELPTKKEAPPMVSSLNGRPSSPSKSSDQLKLGKPASREAKELFVPGTVYYLKRNVEAESHNRRIEYFTLLRRHPGEHFQRILLSSNLISDHKCDSHFYALRDVIKGMPSSLDDKTIS